MYSVQGNLLGCMVNKLSTSGHFGSYYYHKYYRYYSQYYQHPAQAHTSTERLPEETRPDEEEARVA